VGTDKKANNFLLISLLKSFHSINVPSEWGQIQAIATINEGEAISNSFHSINVPSEWGLSWSAINK
jgi:hypothetical protein